jgi:hypothetical protein
VQPDLATVVLLVCFILITGSGMAQGRRQMVESDQDGVASQVGLSQLKTQGASNANVMFTANLSLRSVPTVVQPLSPVFSKGRGFVGAMYTYSNIKQVPWIIPCFTPHDRFDNQCRDLHPSNLFEQC